MTDDSDILITGGQLRALRILSDETEHETSSHGSRDDTVNFRASDSLRAGGYCTMRTTLTGRTLVTLTDAGRELVRSLEEEGSL